MRILVVDDEPDILRACTDLLRLVRPDDEAEQASRLHDALDRLTTGGIDILLTDHRMPDGEGLALAQVVQSMENPPTCILMTAYADGELAQAAHASGAIDALLPKPFDPEELFEMIDLCERRGRHPAAALELDKRLEGIVAKLTRRTLGQNPT